MKDKDAVLVIYEPPDGSDLVSVYSRADLTKDQKSALTAAVLQWAHDEGVDSDRVAELFMGSETVSKRSCTNPVHPLRN